MVFAIQVARDAFFPEFLGFPSCGPDAGHGGDIGFAGLPEV
jgi:hypothetical protein